MGEDSGGDFHAFYRGFERRQTAILREKPDEVTQFLNLCVEAGLNESCFDALREFVCLLSHHENQESKGARVKALIRAETVAGALLEAVEALEDIDFRELFESDENGVFRDIDMSMNRLTAMLSAQRVALGSTKGRRPRGPEQVNFIRDMCHLFDYFGLPVGRGGDFENVCNAGFRLCGVPATAEGPIREFLSSKQGSLEARNKLLNL